MLRSIMGLTDKLINDEMGLDELTPIELSWVARYAYAQYFCWQDSDRRASVKYYNLADEAAMKLVGDETGKPKIVCLCGSTRFSEAYQVANLQETLMGNIVLTIGCDMKSDAALFEHLSEEGRQKIKDSLDELHLAKIDLADEILVLNVGGYVGDSTRREIEYARKHGKAVRWLEPEKVGE